MSAQMRTKQKYGLILSGAMVDDGRRHALRVAVDQLPTTVLQPERRFPVVGFVNGQQRPAQALVHSRSISDGGRRCQLDMPEGWLPNALLPPAGR